MLAYLVFRDGAKWTDVFRLLPGQTVTIGRAPSNQIIIKDDRCSRYHAEVILTEGSWKTRDLDSRNGTILNNRQITGQIELTPGDVIKIGRSQLAFVHDLSKAFPDSSSLIVKEFRENYLEDPSRVEPISREPVVVRETCGKNAFLDPETLPKEPVASLASAALRLLQLSHRTSSADSQAQLGETALEIVADAIEFNLGAVLIFPQEGGVAPPTGEELEIVARRTTGDARYDRPPGSLVGAVLKNNEAVLAGEKVHAICAPIQHDDQIYGVLHFSAPAEGADWGTSELEFALAAGDAVGSSFENLIRRENLAYRVDRMRDENQQLREGLSAESEIIGKSLAIGRVTERITAVAASELPVLIQGERGVGKELVARAVHFASNRNKGPFLSLSCATLDETELESALFGHEKDSFADAGGRKIGKLEAADQGTILVGEIGETPPDVQAKLLRVLEGHPFERLGGSEPIKAEFRLIATTKMDLDREVSEGRFRQDLYLRLHASEIVVPTLRQRTEDVPMLGEYFLSLFRASMGRRLKGFTPEAMEAMTTYRWPGNVRELKNVIERAVLLARGEYLDVDDLRFTSQAPVPETE
ncbi:MAG: sigma 54-interacting transcriptional regulator [Planctomycetales bacterium]